MHGTNDETILYDGSELFGVRYPSAVETVTDWMALNQCTGTLAALGDPIDLIPSIPGDESQIYQASGCQADV